MKTKFDPNSIPQDHCWQWKRRYAEELDRRIQFQIEADRLLFELNMQKIAYEALKNYVDSVFKNPKQ